MQHSIKRLHHRKHTHVQATVAPDYSLLTFTSSRQQAQVEGGGCACAKFGMHKRYRRAPFPRPCNSTGDTPGGDEKQAKNPGMAAVIGDFLLPLPRSLLCSSEQRHFCSVCNMR
ncbi:hypothetical protein PVAP13_4KG236200 [Panicum virgatum]|uniref:Uncharacterized protein n=1 Tax=Panicum virgatum TaxID=38727 RepID=A0A8T0TSV7_PANVG|nr:hypothetical protein PVAP13_4KG236200 [Panicum virgatum]